jgi:hypothetical protein
METNKIRGFFGRGAGELGEGKMHEKQEIKTWREVKFYILSIMQIYGIVVIGGWAFFMSFVLLKIIQVQYVLFCLLACQSKAFYSRCTHT